MFARKMLALALLAGCLVLGPVQAAEKTAAELLPATTVAYVEVAQPKQLLAVVLDHPLRQRLEALPEYQKSLETPQYQQFLQAVEAVEQKLGTTYRAAVESFTEGGLFVGVDALTQGVVVLLKAKDAATLEKHLPPLMELAQAEARRQGNGDAIKTTEHQGLKVYQAGEARWLAVGPWLVITNKDALSQQIVRNQQQASEISLAADKDFQAARATITGQPTAWSYLNVSVLRSVGIGKELFAPKNDNPAGELLLGGLLSTLAKTPFITASLTIETERVALSFAMPHDPAWTPPNRQYYFGPGGSGVAGRALQPRETLLSLATYRDVGNLWLLKEDLFTENVSAQLTQADSNLTTLFSGRDFGREVLGAVRPEIQLVIARQTFEGRDLPAPDIKLPAGALVLRLKEPEKMQRPLKVLFQSLIGFLNVAGAQNGQPPLEQDTEKLDAGQLVSAKYLPGSGEERINYNFSPTVAFVGDRFIIASATPLAKELAALAAQPDQPATATNSENTRGLFYLPVLRQVLQDNRKHLVAQAALNNGSSKEEAEKGIDGLMSLLAIGKTFGLRLATEAQQLKLQAEVKLEISGK